MSQDEAEFLKSIASLPAAERAAAISHRIYALTAEHSQWTSRVPAEWAALDESARAYNIESVRTWARETPLLERWLHAVLEVRLGG
jgi:hypothetical protein